MGLVTLGGKCLLVQTFGYGLQPPERVYSSYSEFRAPFFPNFLQIAGFQIWSEWRLTVIAVTVRIALVDILDLSEVDIPAGVFLHPAVGWG